ncbi:MAG: hypothetical protein Q4G67_14330, partial [Actinomycetia bacterium]|nr:hypothetical protein [Actinomycetes bacterium]
ALEGAPVDIVCISVPTEEDAQAASKTADLVLATSPGVKVYVGGEGARKVSADEVTAVGGTVTECAEQIVKDFGEQEPQAEVTLAGAAAQA